MPSGPSVVYDAAGHSTHTQHSDTLYKTSSLQCAEPRRKLVRARAWLQRSDWQQLPGARRLLQSCSMLLPELTTRRWLMRTAAGGRTLLLPIICHLTCEQTTTSKADSSREWRRSREQRLHDSVARMVKCTEKIIGSCSSQGPGCTR